MNREIYKRVAPHLDRTKQDGGVTTDNMSDLFLLQRSNEQYKDYLKLSFCPELHGYKKDTRSNVNYITKGYSANSIQQEYGKNLVINGTFDYNVLNWDAYLCAISNENNSLKITSNTVGLCASGQMINGLTIGKLYKLTVDTKNNTSGGGCFCRISESGYGYTNLTPSNTDISQFKTYSNTFIPRTTGIILECCLNTTAIGQIGYFDNISVQEVLSSDLTQTSSANQPYLDKIAPAEKLSAKNPNGGSNYLTHPTISFSASDSYTLEIVFNWNGIASNGYANLVEDSDTNKIVLSDSNGLFTIKSNGLTTPFPLSVNKFKYGKTIIFHIVVINNNIYGYVDNIMVLSATFTNNGMILSKIFGISNGRLPSATLYSYHIFSKALSASEVAERSAILRSIFPEIPFTRIGDQIWSVRNFEAVVTPQGNLIPEVQSNTTWATSQTLYNNAYDATNGTVEQKTYAAVKAAAMWCHYGNDPALGAIYGKLYNWFAVKLLQMDIDYYNANNPTTPWGWRVPTQSDFQTLSTYLGGNAVSGGKLKMVGTTYWNSPNIGADNSSGFSAIGGGFRNNGDGGSYGLNSANWMWTINKYGFLLRASNSIIELIPYNDIRYGFLIRLIKA